MQTITFGKHKGKRFDELPSAYLNWIYATVHTRPKDRVPFPQEDELLKEAEKVRMKDCAGCGCLPKSYVATFSSLWVVRCGDSNCVPVAVGNNRYEAIAKWNELHQNPDTNWRLIEKEEVARLMQAN